MNVGAILPFVPNVTFRKPQATEKKGDAAGRQQPAELVRPSFPESAVDAFGTLVRVDERNAVFRVEIGGAARGSAWFAIRLVRSW